MISNSTATKSLALLAVLGAGALLFTTDARSQLGTAKNYVALQPTSPGTAQSGHATISGTAQAAQFVGGGAGLTGLSASAISTGSLADARLSANVALRNAPNTFTGITQFSNFVGVRRTSGSFTPQESFGIGESATNWDGMYVKTATTGKPFYGYVSSTTAYHYLDGADSAWKLFNNGAIRLVSASDGKLGVGVTTPLYMLDVNGTANVTGFRMPTGAGSGRLLQSDASGNATWFQSAWVQSGSSSLQTSATVAIGPPASASNILRLKSTGVGATQIIENNNDWPGTYFRAGIHMSVRSASAEGLVHGIESWTYGSSGTNTQGIRSNATGPASNFGVYSNAYGGTNNIGVYGTHENAGYAGYFQGTLFANSASSGIKSFLIDHPLDPANKYLEHSSIESNERMNLYRGQITTDGKGFATITVPNWFSALNENIQAQLTVVDDSEEFIMAKVVRQNPDGSFRIRTSQGGVLVNWMLSGVRKDPTSRYRPMEVERMKSAYERGRYLDPEAYGLGREHAMVERPDPNEDKKRSK